MGCAPTDETNATCAKVKPHAMGYLVDRPLAQLRVEETRGALPQTGLSVYTFEPVLFGV